jgi:Flp pilus assembly protein TadG
MRSVASSDPAGPAVDTDGGQATVELALAMPVVMILMLAGVQVGLIVRDHLAVVAAARAAARQASIGGSARDGASHSGLIPSRLTVDRVTSGGLVTVTVRYRAPTDLPLVGLLVGDVSMQTSATMALEPDA